MRYPTLSRVDCLRIADQKKRGLEVSIEEEATWVGADGDLDLGPLEKAAHIFTEVVEVERTTSDPDRVEGALVGVLWESLQHVPIVTLDDPGFWRYLSAGEFWDFIVWREHRSFQRGVYEKYIDCATSTESVLTRMYLRASALGGESHSEMAALLPNATDFWRSHVLRVKTGTVPIVTRELVGSQDRERLPTDPLRELARRLNRTWANSIPHLLDPEDANLVIAELRESLVDEGLSD